MTPKSTNCSRDSVEQCEWCEWRCSSMVPSFLRAILLPSLALNMERYCTCIVLIWPTIQGASSRTQDAKSDKSVQECSGYARCEDSSRHKNTTQQNCSSRNTGMPCKNCHDTPGHVLAYMRCMKQSCMASRATSHHFLTGPLQQGQLLSNEFKWSLSLSLSIAISRSSLMVTVSYMLLLSHIIVVALLALRCSLLQPSFQV